MVLILLLLLSISAFLFYHLYYKRQKLPPGPVPLPFLGNLLQLNHHAEEVFLKWRREYGPVYTYWVGNFPVVCVADYPKMVETFVKDADTYAARFTLPYEKVFRGGGGAEGNGIHGVISASGDRWREQRRFALQVLRDFGLGKNLMQERILNELGAMFGKINARMGKVDELNMPELIDVAVGSIINNLMFGYRLEGEKESDFWDIKHVLDEHMRAFANPLVWLWICHPNLLDRVPPFSIVGQRVKNRIKKLMDFFEVHVVEHQQELEASGHWEEPPKDFVDAFLKEMKRKEGQQHHFDIKQCTNVCFDLWIAGQETTSTTLAWGIAFLLNNGHCLREMYAELDANIGTDRLITVADKQNLPYTCAVINEIHRFANLLPVNIAHELSRDVKLDGYELSEGTAVVPQISAIFVDDKIFPEPNVFKPERYLNEDGKLMRCDELIPFSIGKRQCLGESLARMEMFLFIANIFNQYTLSPGKVMPSLERKNGAIAHYLPYTCRLEKRKAQFA